MDIVFNCPNCNQEMVVDETAAGQDIECPACGEKQTIPQESPARPEAHAEVRDGRMRQAPHTLSVAMHEGPSESLIKKKAPEAAAGERAKKIRSRCIKRSLCVEVGHDNFDKVVSEFLQGVGEENIINMIQINYEAPDANGKLVADYGVMIVYRG